MVNAALGKLPRGSVHHATSSAFPQIVPLSPKVFSHNDDYFIHNTTEVHDLQGRVSCTCSGRIRQISLIKGGPLQSKSYPT